MLKNESLPLSKSEDAPNMPRYAEPDDISVVKNLFLVVEILRFAQNDVLLYFQTWQTNLAALLG